MREEIDRFKTSTGEGLKKEDTGLRCGGRGKSEISSAL